MSNEPDNLWVDKILVEGRECGDCKACCEVLCIDTLDTDNPVNAFNKDRVELVKGEGPLCEHWQDGVQCIVYDKRPMACQTFYCLWMIMESWPEEYRPDRMGIIWTSQQKLGKMPYIGADTYNAPFDVFNKPEVRKIIDIFSPHVAVIIRHSGLRSIVIPDRPFPKEGDLHAQ